LHVPQAAVALAELHTAEMLLKPVVHTFDATELEAPLAKVAQRVEAVERIVKRAERERSVARAGWLVGVGLLAVLFVLLVFKSIRLARRRPA
jgi:hypothetical protein